MVKLVLIPALGCDAGLYGEIAPVLETRVQLQTVLADRSDLADCVAQVLAAAEGPFVVLGTSFGGRVALETALAAPERVVGLVVIGASAGPAADPAIGFKRSNRLRSGELEQVAAEMGAMISHLSGPRGPHARDAFIAMMRRQGAELVARQSDALAKRSDLWPRLAEITCPALMLWGKHDQFSPAAEGLRLSAGVVRGRYVELADCGHFPTLEYPYETAAVLVHWLQDEGLAVPPISGW
jgi:pimeloyl-ACP methyl ester carboxylesterase